MSYTASGEWYDDGSTYVPVPIWCPGCPADAPATTLYTIFYCSAHLPAQDGDLDRIVDTSQYLSGTSEAGGAENRAFCDLVRARQTD